jgi:hypothetical protein
VQHHALARLALALATMRPAPAVTLDKAGRVQLRLDERIAPVELVIAQQMLVEMLHVPARLGIAV